MINSCNTLYLFEIHVMYSQVFVYYKGSSALNSRIWINLDCHVLRVQALTFQMFVPSPRNPDRLNSRIRQCYYE
jgi:hypothetical protein